MPSTTASPWRPLWTFPDDVCYLNHGSFGPSPRQVQQARQRWSEQLESEPMDFLARKLEPALLAAAECLARFVGTMADNLVFVENATVGMNVVAASVALKPGDEVLLTDHEYGAVRRIWQRACQRSGANLVVAAVPCAATDRQQVVDAVADCLTQRTRLLVVSHLTSPTATIFRWRSFVP